MATNKNAIVRYQTLDRCFRNPGRKYFIEDLIEACNESLLDLDPNSTGVKRRQIFDDIKFMRDSRGYNAPIESYRYGKKTYYRYEELSFSINSQPLNEQEAMLLKGSLMTLSRFKGMPQFQWIEEMTARLESSFKLKIGAEKIIDFEENIYLKGLENISSLFNAILYHTVLKVAYKSFQSDQELGITFHPYYLKQYNNRWFVFGWNDEKEFIMNLALDRIVSISESKNTYIKNTRIDFSEYFEDVIGVTVPENSELQKIILKINKKLWPYIETKPLHGSQKTKKVTDDFTLIELELFPNYEFESLILSHGEKIEVIEPEEIRSRIANKIRDIYNIYF